MKKQMVVKGQTVVLAGKVRGYIYETKLTDGTIYRRFVPKWTNNKPAQIMTPAISLTEMNQEVITMNQLRKQVEEPAITSPFIKIANEGRKRYVAEREARLKQLQKENERKQMIREFREFFGIDYLEAGIECIAEMVKGVRK
jgi:hypothetical protein